MAFTPLIIKYFKLRRDNIVSGQIFYLFSSQWNGIILTKTAFFTNIIVI